MASIREYHRPGSIDEALALLDRADATSVILGGGTTVVPRHAADPIEVIDLQALPLGDIAPDGDDRISVGAMTRLQQVVDDTSLPDLIRNAAHREAPSTIRNAATVGGAVVEAHWESGLVAALLVHDAAVQVIGVAGRARLALPELLADRSQLAGRIIVAVSVAGGGSSGWAGTGRTPADTPIVAAYARRYDGATSLALTGVAATPRLVDREELAGLDPPGDFRGSPEYRRALATTLTARVLASLDGAA